jgi:cyclohexadienyl dehydratase
MQALALAALIAILPSSHLDTILERGEILVGTTGDYRPFSYRRPDGKFEGFDIDAARQLGLSLGVEVRFVQTSWPGLEQGLLDGRYDIAMSGITRTLDRQKVASLSDPYLSIGKCPLIRRADRERFTDLDAIDRAGVRVGVNPGGTNESFVRGHIHAAEIVVIEDNLSIPDAVATGRVDVMLTDNVEAVLVANQDSRLFAVLPDSPLSHDELSYMLPAHDATFLNWVNLWLHQMRLTGELDRLRERWISGAAASQSDYHHGSLKLSVPQLLRSLTAIPVVTQGVFKGLQK